ncbi:MAG: DUF4870 domain-containing protein [Tannerella sp.]|uniref:DUF4870 domain-containing protein n=1 Tax=Tannerella sp. TaxID=2382127 RepID=UPI003FA1B767
MSQENFTADPQDVQANKVMAILAYFGILVLVPLFAAKESPFARFHANQGLILCIIWFVILLASMVLTFVSPFFGIISLLNIVILVFAIIGIINAAKGEMKELPLVGKFRIIK